MAIQEVNVGTIANDGTGDDPRTGISKVNSNFTDTTNMASKLAQTSNVDTTVGRGLLVGSFGLGSTAGITYTDTEAVGGFNHFVRFESGASNLPIAGTFEGYSVGISGFQCITIELVSGNSGDAARSFKKSSRNGTWTTWVEVFTEANLNPNVFGGTDINDVVGIGVADAVTTILASLPIMLVGQAVSITVTGTFTLRNATFAAVTTGLGVSDMVLAGNSGNRVALVAISNATGLIVGDTYYITQDTASASILVG